MAGISASDGCGRASRDIRRVRPLRAHACARPPAGTRSTSPDEERTAPLELPAALRQPRHDGDEEQDRAQQPGGTPDLVDRQGRW